MFSLTLTDSRATHSFYTALLSLTTLYAKSATLATGRRISADIPIHFSGELRDSFVEIGTSHGCTVFIEHYSFHYWMWFKQHTNKAGECNGWTDQHQHGGG
jgi:hypothetical protein